ncbi:hypothetical protein BG58_11075 [Caballeronia jiangsuensis]|nr:hypothetical protein BG58_11075 [Caballeronia jiangsuensis]
MTEIIKFQPNGAPATLLENALELADNMKFALMVFVNNDGTIETEWSQIENHLEALGAIEVLRNAFMQASEGAKQ